MPFALELIEHTVDRESVDSAWVTGDRSPSKTSSVISSSISVVSVPFDVTGDGPTISLGLSTFDPAGETPSIEFGWSDDSPELRAGLSHKISSFF